MVGNFEAIGDAVTGGVLGRAVEPRRAKRRRATRTRRTASTAARSSPAPIATLADSMRTSTRR